MHSAVEQDVEGSGDTCISAFRVRGLRLTLGLTTTWVLSLSRKSNGCHCSDEPTCLTLSLTSASVQPCFRSRPCASFGFVIKYSSANFGSFSTAIKLSCSVKWISGLRT
jgi:hypothetical protein